jgi:hypothetical protein
MTEGKTMVFIGGPMSGFMDQRYHELSPMMTFQYFPDRERRDQGRMVVYQFAHFQDDTYYYEFARTVDIGVDEDDEEESL